MFADLTAESVVECLVAGLIATDLTYRLEPTLSQIGDDLYWTLVDCTLLQCYLKHTLQGYNASELLETHFAGLCIANQSYLKHTSGSS